MLAYGSCKVLINEELQLKPERSTRKFAISCYDEKTKSRYDYVVRTRCPLWPVIPSLYLFRLVIIWKYGHAISRDWCETSLVPSM